MAHSHDHEEYRKIEVLIEEEQLELLTALADEYREKLGKGWDLSAIVRVAVGDFLTKMGKMS